MREFCDGKDILSPITDIFAPPKLEKPKSPSVVEDEQRSRRAADEERRRARSALQAQNEGGRRSTLLSSLQPSRGVASERPTLLG